MSTAVARRELAPIPQMLGAQLWSVILGYLRNPMFTLFSMVLPVMFFCFFGLTNIHRHISESVTLGSYILASMSAYAMSNVLVYNIGINQATQRARKLDLLQRATPLPAGVAMLASIIGGLALAILALLPLMVVAAIGGVQMPVSHWLDLTGAVIIGAMPMLGLGMLIGYGSNPNVAPALASLIYLPMAFASGLFVPLSEMPSVIREVAHYLPLYHLGQLSWNAVGYGQEPVWQALAWIAGWTIVLFVAAARAYRLDQLRKFS